jgi:rubrerythrin
MPNASLPEKLPPDFAAAFTAILALERLDIEDMKLMVLLESAGDPLYQRLAALTPDPEAKELLLTNGREETAHAHRLKQSIEILTGQPYAIPPLADNPYAEPPPFEALSADLLQGVAAAETDGDALYQKYADHEANGEVADLLRQNGREESRHGERVSRVIEILRAAEAS